MLSPPNCGVNPPGKPLLEREAARVGEDLRQGALVGDVVRDFDHRASGRPFAVRGQRIADQQGLAAVRAEDPAPGVGIAEEVTEGHRFRWRSARGRKSSRAPPPDGRSAPHSLKSSFTFAEPEICAGSATSALPAAMSRAASSRWTLRLVGSVLPYSTLRFANPFAPSGAPMLPATVTAWPPPSPNAPVLTVTAPPERSDFSRKFITPAMASEPYWGGPDAPSRRISTCRNAIAGMAEMSGPWAPSETPLPSQVMTAPRWAALAVDQHQRVIRRQTAQVGRPHDARRVVVVLGVDVEGRQDAA